MSGALSVIGSRGFPSLDTVVPYGIDAQVGSCATLISGGARGPIRIWMDGDS